MGKACRFCNIINSGLKIYDDVDKPFMIGKKYYSLVSIGAFVNGWTLLISKEHKYNLCNDYGSIEFYNYLRNHITVIRKKLNWSDRVIAFEHGANNCDSETACGTSHAHLHILPFSESILSDIVSEKEWIECKWKAVANIVGDSEYLLYCEEPEKGMNAQVYLHIVVFPESQYFRRVIFNKLKLEGSYSYKEDPRLEESIKTKRILED